LIVNRNISFLERIHSLLENETLANKTSTNKTSTKNFIISRQPKPDTHVINTGSYFVRSSAWSRAFILLWVSNDFNAITRDRWENWVDQSILMVLWEMNQLEFRKNSIVVEDERLFNSQFPNNYYEGDFVAHGYGLAKLIWNRNDIINISMKDN